MPISPEDAERLGEEIRDIYTEAESIMLGHVARRIARGIDQEGWAERKLLEVGALRREVQREIVRLDDRVPARVEAVLADAFAQGVTAAEAELGGRGIEVAFGTSNPLFLRVLLEETVDTLSSTHLVILRRTEDIYRSVIRRAVAQVVTGTTTRLKAAQSALDAFAMRGITGFVDAAGRSWEVASYTDMATRTATARAAINGHGDALRSNGHDLVIVSDAPMECPRCAPWEGKVLSLSGSARYPSLAQAEADGLFHPNCRHSIGAHFPGFTRGFRGTADPAGYGFRQEQRYLERGVRAWRRRESVALSEPARATASAKAREWQGRLRSHVDAHGLKRQPHRERLGAR